MLPQMYYTNNIKKKSEEHFILKYLRIQVLMYRTDRSEIQSLILRTHAHVKLKLLIK